MKASRLNASHVGKSVKARMRILRVAGGFRPIDFPQQTKVIGSRTWRLHPTRGWRVA